MASSEQEHLLSFPEKPRIIYAGDSKDYTLWNNNKETLRLLYLDQNGTLEDVKRRMETEYQFPVLPLKDYETILRDHLKFRKKVGRSDWGPIGYRIEKRRLAGKASHVYLGSKLLPPRSVKREVRRYNPQKTISAMIREGHSPPLPKDITIRTPSPQPTQHVTTMDIGHTFNTCHSTLVNNASASATHVMGDFVISDISTMADKHARLDAINAVKLRSPFSQFLTTLHKMLLPTPSSGSFSGTRSGPPSYSTLLKNATSSHLEEAPAHHSELESFGSLSVPDLAAFLDPTQLGFPRDTILPAMLAQACFAVSNGSDWSSTFTKNLFEWIEVSAELSENSIWENLVDLSISLSRKRAFELLIDSARTIGRDQWIMRRSGEILCAAVRMELLQTVQRLLVSGISPDSPAVVDNNIKRTPLQDAAKSLQPDMINVLCQNGADVNLQTIRSNFDGGTTQTDAPLIALINAVDKADDNDNIIGCAKILLDRGARVDLYRDFGARYFRDPSSETENSDLLKWLSFNGPQWLIDFTWLKLGSGHKLLHFLLERSIRSQIQVTVPGIFAEVQKGLAHLEIYLNLRRFPLVAKEKTALLETALSWAAARDELDALTCLLSLGVDPNIGTISSILGHSMAREWEPAYRARWKNDELLSVLRQYGARHADPSIWPRYTAASPRSRTIPDIIERALLLHQDQSQFMKISNSDIETHGLEVLRVFLSHANRRNFPACASMCDFLWSNNVPKDIRWDGERNPLHFAISQNCCLDMCKFLVARGYEVQNHPRGDVSELLHFETMLSDAIKNFRRDRTNCSEVIDFLLEHGASMDFPSDGPTLLESVLDLAYDSGSLEPRERELFEKFLALGASVDVPSSRKYNTLTWPSVLCKLIDLEADDDLLFRVITASKDVDQQGDPLAMAFRHGRLAVVESLLSRGAKVNHHPRGDFRGVLQVACSSVSSCDAQENINTHVRLIERLIILGADVNGSAALAIGGSAPLQHAAHGGNIEVASLLLTHGADVNAQGCGLTEIPMRALDYAAGYGRLDMVQLLRGVGGISGIPGETGVDGAIQCAEEERHYSISDFLRSTIDRSDM